MYSVHIWNGKSTNFNANKFVRNHEKETISIQNQGTF